VPARYRHTQVGWAILAFLVLFALLFWRGLPPEAAAVARLPFLVVAVVLLLGFSALTVEVDADAVRLRLGVGLVRRRIPLADVGAWRAVRNPWYSGWGIRLGPNGVLWNVSGFEAVELDLPGGRRFRVGTDEPAELVAAIARAKGASPGPTSGGPAPPAREWSPRGAVWRWLPAIALGTALVVGLFWAQLRPPGVRVSPEGIEVDTLFYGATFAAADIEAVSLEPRLPRIEMRTNGFAGAGTLRGWFRVEGWGNGRLYVEQGMAPYVVVRLRQGYVVVNFREPGRTRALFEEVARQWPDRVRPVPPPAWRP
jgi:hypothetical protein